MSTIAPITVGENVGKHVPALASSLRPTAEDELGQWGGPRLVAGRRVLDLGCGDGRLALGVAKYAREVLGLDPDAQLIRNARDRAASSGMRNVRFEVGAAQELAVTAGAFDVVILSWTL